MMRNSGWAWSGAIVLLALSSRAAMGQAAEGSPTQAGSDMNFTASGLIRSETALSTNNDRNPFNQRGNPFNGESVQRNGLFPDTTVRNGQDAHQPLNMQLFRLNLDATAKFSSKWSGIAKFHALFDPAWYREFDPGSVGSTADGPLYGKPNYFKYDVEGKSRPNPLEWTGRNYQAYFPSLFAEYNDGPFNLRIGNQQIAWGQAIFFRVLDVPNGLDLRRHSLLDYVPEEFSDKRVQSLALRASFQASDQWLLDGFVAKFQPSVVPNPNTPYNVIPSQFTIHDLYANYDKKVNYGMRVKGQAGDVGVQGVLARRYNPDGVYRWTQSGVNRDIPGIPGSGLALQGTPFEVDSSGVWSADEWFNFAGRARLNGVTGLNSAINDFQPFTGLLGAVAVPNYAAAHQELDTFFQLAGGALVGANNGGLRGHLAREYRAETNIGGGASYVLPGEPGSWSDQLIVNVEVLYTRDRTFTNPSLSVDFLKKNEWLAALVLEKYQRFSTDLPATYVVAQLLYKSQSDLFGRYLGGYGGTTTAEPTGKGGGYTALALAVQQPFANLIWRADLAVLYDTGGGILVQPAVRWKPNGTVTVEAFYNYLNGHMRGNPNNNALSTVGHASEFVLRVGAQF